MPEAFDKLQPFSFAGHKFPYKSYSIRGGIRDHVHEYPHSPGGAPEKLGRKLYEIQVNGIFLEEKAMQASQRARYGAQLFLAQVNGLRALFEDQVTDSLVIPHVGSIKAYAIGWEEKADTRNRSGIEVDMTFREDQEGAFVFEVLQLGPTTLPERVDTLDDVRARLYAGRQEPSLFAQINTVANSLLAIKDQNDLYGSLIASKIYSLSALLGRVDTEVDDMNDPDNLELLEAVHALWDAVNQLGNDMQSKSVDLRNFTVPLLMSVTDVSNAIYGNASKATDIMQLNALENPMAIPAGTSVRYYPVAA